MKSSNHPHNVNTHNSNEQIIKNNLQKLKCHISNDMKRHQMEIIRSNKKLSFYSILKTDVSKSDYLEQVKNLKQALAKFRSGNRNLRIESGRHCTPKKIDSFNNTEKTMFLFNNVDTFICKILGYFIYEALHIREL